MDPTRRPAYHVVFLLTVVLATLSGCTEQKSISREEPAPRLAKAAQPTANPFDHAIFHKCYDGDTCTFSLPGLPDVFGDHIAVRLVGIDAPEIKGHCQKEKDLAIKAKDLLNQKLTHARVVQIRHTARDKYFRVLAEVVADGEELNELLVKSGLAVPYSGGTKTKDWCAERP